jgi:hypothetical protein
LNVKLSQVGGVMMKYIRVGSSDFTTIGVRRIDLDLHYISSIRKKKNQMKEIYSS